jgi:hypothetical protein
VFEEAQAYCLLPSRTDSALAAEGRTARADAAKDDGVLAAVRRPPADGRPTLMLRTCGSTRRINELPRQQRLDKSRLCAARFGFEFCEV